MALHFTLMVNGEPIGHMDILRTDTSADGLHTYRWTYFREGRQENYGEVQHQYDDGAIELAHLALAELAAKKRLARRGVIETVMTIPLSPTVDPDG